MKILEIGYGNGSKSLHVCKRDGRYQTTRNKIQGNDGVLLPDEDFGTVVHTSKNNCLSFLLGHLEDEGEVVFYYDRGMSRQIVRGGEIEGEDNVSWCSEEPVWEKSDSTRTSKTPIEDVLNDIFGSY